MRTFLFALVTLILSNTNVYAYAYDINVCLPNKTVQAQRLSISDTGEVQFNHQKVHIADIKINHGEINIFQRNGILYFTNICENQNSLAVAYRNGAWILFQDLGSLAPTKGDPVATAIFFNKNSVSVGEYESYTPMTNYRGTWKIGSRRVNNEDVDIWTTVGLVYVDERNDFIIIQDDESLPLRVHHNGNGNFVVDVITN